MNAMIQALKGTLAVLALAALGVLLRWITAGSLSGLRTYDLDSLTVLAVSTIAWIAYAWLTVAVLLTALEQVPGAIGTLAGAAASRITTQTARALLRSGLGVAAVTPLTLTAANATPTPTQIHQTPAQTSGNQAAPHEPTTNLSNFRTTEPASTVQISGSDSDRHTSAGNRAPHQPPTAARQSTTPSSTAPAGQTGANQTPPQKPTTSLTNFRATEPASTIRIAGTSGARDSGTTETAPHSPTGTRQPAAPDSTTQTGTGQTTPHKPASDRSAFRATEPASSVRLGGDESAQAKATGGHDTFRATEPASTVQIGGSTPHPQNAAGATPDSKRTADQPTEPTSEHARADVPRRPAGERAQNALPDQATNKRPQPDAPNHPAGEQARTDAPNHPAGEQARTDVPGQPAGERARSDVPDRAAGEQARSDVSDRAAGERGPNGVSEPAGVRGRGETPGRPGRGWVGVPDRPVDGAPVRYTELRPSVPVRVVVRDGDSLWSLAARELGPAATNDAIAARWPDWYAVNRQVIGDDPDLIVPGQVLRIPPAPNGDHLPPQHQEP